MRPSGAIVIAVADANEVVSGVSVKPVGRVAAGAVIAQAIEIKSAERSFMPEYPSVSVCFCLKEYSKHVGHETWTNVKGGSGS